MQTQSELGMEMLVLIQDMELAERKLEKQLEYIPRTLTTAH